MTAAFRNIVLTGAAGGLGHAIAEALAPHCARMVLTGRDPHKLDALAATLGRRHTTLDLVPIAGDLTDEATRAAIHDAAQSAPAPADLLINNAGINEFHAFAAQSPAAIERLFEINLLAPIRLTQTLLPLMRSAPRAQIVNIGSIFGYLGYPGFAVYCASKFGLRGFSQALRRELADTSIAVRYFAPRATRTALTTARITAMNRALKTREDSPDLVARKLLDFIAGTDFERKIGFPERLYVLLNHVVPRINDNAIRARLETIKKYLPDGGNPAH